MIRKKLTSDWMQYRIVSSAENINSKEELRLLKMTYWANNRTIEQIEESMGC